MSKQQKITSPMWLSLGYGAAESNCGADHDSLSHCRVCHYKSQSRWVLHACAHGAKHNSYNTHSIKLSVPKRRERVRERPHRCDRNKDTWDTHTHTERIQHTPRWLFLWGAQQAESASESGGEARTHTLTAAAAAEEIVGPSSSNSF